MIEKLKNKIDINIIDIHKLHFGENKSFFVQSESDNFLLKVYRSHRGFKKTPEQEIEFTQHLASLGVNTSEYIVFNNGSYTDEIDGKK